MPLANVIIANWNGRDLLSECLEGLRQQTFRDIEITLVDNGSEDGSVDLVAHNYPEVNLVPLTENLGFTGANNVAFRLTQVGDYVALLNNDAVAEPRWLEALVGALESHLEAGFAASRMLFYDNPALIDRAGDAFTTAGVAMFRGRNEPRERYNEMKWVFGASAGAAIYRTAMLREIGIFDDDFFLLHEDVDLSFRAQLAGYKCLYVPEAVVFHKGSRSIASDSETAVYYGHRNLEWTYIKNMPSRLLLRSLLQHVIYDLAAFFYFAARGHAKAFLRAKRDALKGLKKILSKRRQIQDNKRVKDAYIWGLFEKELFSPRLKTSNKVAQHQ